MKLIYNNNFGAIEFTEDSPFWITEIDSLSSVDVDITEEQSVGQTGTSVIGQSVSSRNVTVTGIIFGDLIGNRRKLLSIIAPQVLSRFTVIDDDEKTWYLDGYAKTTPIFDETEGQQNFQFIFKAPYPFWRSDNEINVTLAGLRALFKTPFYTGGEWKISEYEDRLLYRIEYVGTVPAPLVISFDVTAETVNPTITKAETNETITIQRTFEVGEKMTINTADGMENQITIKRADGSVENGFKYIAVGSALNMTLTRGVNTFRYAADEGRTNMRVHIKAVEEVVTGV